MTTRNMLAQLRIWLALSAVFTMTLCFDVVAKTGRVDPGQIRSWMPNGEYFKVGSEPFVSGKTAERILSLLQSGIPVYVIVAVEQDSSGDVTQIQARRISAARAVANSPLVIHCDYDVMETYHSPSVARAPAIHCHGDWEQHFHPGNPGTKYWHRHVGGDCAVSSSKNPPASTAGQTSSQGRDSSRPIMHCHQDWEQHFHPGNPGTKYWHRHVGGKCAVSSTKNP